MEFEIHITVQTTKELDEFKKDCDEIGVKPILIDLVDQEQLMTSSKHRYNGDMRDILVPMYTKLQFDKGYQVKRMKVEKKPESIKDINFKYYETHFRLTLPKGYDRTALIALCYEYNFRLSRNLFKVSDEFDYQMITHRTKTGGLSQFNLLVNKMKTELNNLGIVFDKIEIEECIFDTNESLDYEWLK